LRLCLYQTNQKGCGLARTRYKIVEDCSTYFVTTATVNWLPLFSIPDLAQIVLDAMRFLHDNQRVAIHAYVLLENHLHFIGSSPHFSGEMRKFKSFTARAIIDILSERGPRFYLEQLRHFKSRHKSDQTYQVWQEGFHPKAIQNEQMLMQKIEYIHYNPVRRGYVDNPENWRYSSYRQYVGKEGLVPLEPLLI
jgi:putative transposase